ncbi:MAG: fimbrillin family protein [Bacteroides sp.]|nr:fimbrillin family protein [Bacteroides sp.]
MKKNLFLLGLAVAAMTSCTNDEVVEMKQPTQKTIGFETFVNKTTRAIGAVDGTNLKNFWVLANYGTAASSFASLYDDPEEVYLEGSVWKNNTVKYWTNNVYNFAAYADDNTSNSAPSYVTLNQGTLQISNYTLDYALTDAANNNAIVYPSVCNQKDIVADVVTIEGEMNYSDKVNFTLEHLLSKVRFTVVNNSNYPMSISALKISGINNKGSISIVESTALSNGPTWTLPAEAERKIITIYPIAASTENIAANSTVVSADFLVLPQDLANVIVEIEAQFYDPNSLNDIIDRKDFTSASGNALRLGVGDYTSWKPGNFYNYTISLPAAGKQIEFDLTDVTGWNPAAGETTNNDGTKTPNPIELNSSAN